VRDLSERSAAYARAVAAIDAANAADPNPVTVRGDTSPLALVHGRLAVAWVDRLVEEPSEAVLLAARAHHLRRWELPRAHYPAGRNGYLRWRRAQKERHAREVAVLLVAAGYDDTEIGRVQELVKRTRLAWDPDAQAVEDAACLVFLETQLADTARRFDRARMLDVLRKTAAKMTPRGLAAVAEVPLGDRERALIDDALS